MGGVNNSSQYPDSETDILSDTLKVMDFDERMYVRDTDNGKRIMEEVADLEELLAVYRDGK